MGDPLQKIDFLCRLVFNFKRVEEFINSFPIENIYNNVLVRLVVRGSSMIHRSQGNQRTIVCHYLNTLEFKRYVIEPTFLQTPVALPHPASESEEEDDSSEEEEEDEVDGEDDGDVSTDDSIIVEIPAVLQTPARAPVKRTSMPPFSAEYSDEQISDHIAEDFLSSLIPSDIFSN